MNDTPFCELLQRVRQGDERAASELVRRYEPIVRVAIRVRLSNQPMNRLLDSVDVCQSVLANFFVRAAAGQFDLDQPEQLVKLLVTMARNHLINLTEKHRAARRDQARVEAFAASDSQMMDRGPSPSRIVANRELLDEFRRHLSDEERWIADQRGSGRAWADIASERGEQANALRMRFTRALDRVAQELGLDE